MTISFADIPTAPESAFLKRTRPPLPSRRLIIRSVAGAATAVAFGALETVNAAVAKAAYYQDYTDIHGGPCTPGGYADKNDAKGLKCGPSLICSECCWPLPSTRFNRTGWHRTGAVGGTLYTQRPNQCWAGTYDAWRWKFKDGHTYRCSDGYRFTSRGATKTICPWSVS